MDYSLMKEQLEDEYRDAFSAVITYGTLKNYSDEIMNERIIELFDTLLTAQTRGKPVNKIVGNNIERFCRDFYGDCSGWDMVTKFLESFFITACITFVITLICVITDTGSVEQSRYNITPCIIGGLIYVIFNAVSNFIIVPLMFKTKKIKPAVWHNISVVLLLVIFITALVLGARKQSRIYIPELTYLICSGAYIAIYFTARSVIRYRKYGSIASPDKKIKKDSFYKEMEYVRQRNITIKSWVKQYKYLSIRHKTDPVDFVDRLKRTELSSRFSIFAIPAFTVVIFVISVIQVFIESDVQDAVIFTVISGIVEFFICKFIYKMFSDCRDIQAKIISDYEASGLPFPEFAERYLNPENSDTYIIEDTVTEEQKI